MVFCVTQPLEVRLPPCGQVDQDPPLALLIEPSAVDRINAEALGEGREAIRIYLAVRGGCGDPIPD